MITLSAGAFIAPLVLGQTPPIVSQVIKANNAVFDQVGNILLGNEIAREELGMDHARGCRVEILRANTGIIYPPDKDGIPHPDNVLLHVTSIGAGMDPNLEHPGKFAALLSPRPENGVKIFVRVFNAPARDISSFYSDSSLFTVSWTTDDIFFANLPHTATALDADDDDGDGLNNSWEKWYGSTPYMVDTDHDGFNDLDEFLAGTDPDNWDSFLQITGMAIENGRVILQYQAGKDRPIFFQQATNLMQFGMCHPSGVSTNCPPGLAATEVTVASDSSIQVFRLGVPAHEF